MNARCPGIEQFVKNTRDLTKDAFERLVSHRARKLGQFVEPIRSDESRREAEARIEKVNLERDFLPVRFLADGNQRARAVCRIRTATSFGTGFLIGPGILMTNNHVLGSVAEAANSFAEFDFEDGQQTQTASILPAGLFITDADLDFTIVACQELVDVPRIPLLRSPALVTRNERVNIIQHPEARPKEVALHDNHVERIMDKVVRYRTDTQPGSSGSPVFNNDWELVALHHAGEAQSGGMALNEGIRISAIVSHLLARRGRESTQRVGIDRVLQEITGSSPQFGFFDMEGLLEDPNLEVVVDTLVGSREFCDVGFWNIEHFNAGVPDTRIDAVADVMAELALDVFGLTEVQGPALERLVEALGARGVFAGFEVLDTPGSQDIAVLFDRDTTTVAARSDLSQKYARQLKQKTDSGRTVFPRHPLFAECTVTDDLGRNAKFLMIVVHLKAFGDPQSRARRRKAAEILAAIIDDIREQEGLQIVLGGDFNERLDTDVLSAIKGSPDLISLTLDDATSGDRSAISFVGDRHRSLIDHVIVSSDVQLGDISGDDAAIVRLDRSMPDFADDVSDHVPVAFRIVFRDVPVNVDEEPAASAHTLEIPEGAAAINVSFQAEERKRRRKRRRTANKA